VESTSAHVRIVEIAIHTLKGDAQGITDLSGRHPQGAIVMYVCLRTIHLLHYYVVSAT
jgi:hypothetical protein